ncbi:like-Sm domain-containing protein [Tanacetum coccineum]|uniref:Like-Sm domain-containing protein n=1 Tax=Tanacetum coccineum TaxID=301880 RepID=A0ABQ5FLL2_9ASTR
MPGKVDTAYWAGFLRVLATFKSISDNIPNLLDLLYIRIVIFMDTTYVDNMDTPYWELVKRVLGDFIKQNLLEVGDQLELYQDEHKNLVTLGERVLDSDVRGIPVTVIDPFPGSPQYVYLSSVALTTTLYMKLRTRGRHRYSERKCLDFDHATDIDTEMENAIHENEQTSIGNNSSISHVKKLLFRRMLVGVNDGRFFMGAFYCMDKQGNIILQDAVEYRSTRRSSPSLMEQRGLGLILIPFTCRISCHVDCSIDEQLALMSLQA